MFALYFEFTPSNLTDERKNILIPNLFFNVMFVYTEIFY